MIILDGEHDDESSSEEDFGDEEVDTFKVDVETIPADSTPKLGPCAVHFARFMNYNHF